MKQYIVQELFGSLFSDDLVFEAENKQQAIKKYLERRKIQSAKVVYDSIKNSVRSGAYTICVQEGWYNKETNTKHIRGNRGFYKILKNET